MPDEKKEAMFGPEYEPGGTKEAPELEEDVRADEKAQKNESIEQSAYPNDVKELIRKMDKLRRDHDGVVSNMPLNSEYWALQSELSFKLSAPRKFPDVVTRELKEALKSAVPTSTVKPIKELIAESEKPEPLGELSLKERLDALKEQEQKEKDSREYYARLAEQKRKEAEEERQRQEHGATGPDQPTA